MKNVQINQWNVDVQPVDEGFASFIDVSFNVGDQAFEGSIQEDCGTYVDWIGLYADDCFHELDEDVKSFILEKALNSIKAAQAEYGSSVFMSEIAEHENYDLIHSVAEKIQRLGAGDDKVATTRAAKGLVQADGSFSFNDAMIYLQISFGLTQSQSSDVCCLARGLAGRIG